MAKKKTAAKTKKAAAKKTVSKASKKKTVKAAPKAAAKPAAPKKAVAKKAAPKKAAGKTTAKPTKKTAAKSTAKIISMDQARKAQSEKKADKKAGVKATTKATDFSGIFAPLDDRIVIQRAGVSDRTPGGLYIPETVADRPNQGKVVAVGRGHRDKKGRVRPLDVQLGDTVMYAPYSGSEISVNGVDVIVLREEEVLAIMK